MAEISREEVCLGAKNWLDARGGADADALRVYHCMCELGDGRPQDVVARLAGSDDPITLERAEAAWGRLVEQADRQRQGYL